MSTAEQNPGPADASASPWGIPASVPPIPAPGGHLPAFGIPAGPAAPPPQPPQGQSPAQSQGGQPQPPYSAGADAFTQFPGVYVEPESHLTQVPPPPAMRSPYGAPLQEPRLLLAPRAGNGTGTHGGDAQHDSSAKRRRTIIVSSLAAVAVVGVGAAVAMMGGGTPQKNASLAGASQDSTTSSPTGPAGGPTSSFTRPDGDTQVGEVQAGGVLPTGDPSSAVSTGAARKPTSAPSHIAATSSTSTATASQPGSVVQTSAAQPGNPQPSAPGSTAKPPPAPTTIAKPPPPPSADCTYLNLPAAKMPVISQGSPGSASAVKQLQCLMKKSELGIKPLAIDGVWGTDTQAALVAFQKCNNAPTVHPPGGNPPYARLTVGAAVGPATWADLYFWDNQNFNGVSYYCNGTR